MKKVALSLVVIAASGAYVWSQSGKTPTDDLLGAGLPVEAIMGNAAPARSVSTDAPPSPPAPEPVPFVTTLPPISGASAEAPAGAAAQPSSAPPPGTAQGSPSTAVKPIATDGDFGSDLSPAPSATMLANVPLPHIRPAVRITTATRLAPARVTLVAARASGFTDGTYTGPVTDAYYGNMQIAAIVQGGRLVAIKVLQFPSDRRTSIAINRQALPMLRDEVITAQSANVDIISGATLTSDAFIRSLDGALKQATL